MLKFRGVKQVTDTLKRIADKFPDKVGAAMYQEAQIEMTEAKRRVPVDTGTLRASGFVNDPERHGRQVTVTLGFGGAAEEYALIVHEDLEAFHKVGQAKYLESVLDESAPYIKDRIAERLKRQGLK